MSDEPVSVSLRVNGATHVLTIDSGVSLLDVLRDHREDAVSSFTRLQPGRCRSVLRKYLFDCHPFERRAEVSITSVAGSDSRGSHPFPHGWVEAAGTTS